MTTRKIIQGIIKLSNTGDLRIAADFLKRKGTNKAFGVFKILSVTDKGTYQNRTQITVFHKTRRRTVFVYNEVLDETQIIKKKLYHLLLWVKFNS
jgi:hypothetical protein